MTRGRDVGDRPIVAVTRAELPGDAVGSLEGWTTTRCWRSTAPPTADELADFIADAVVVIGDGADRFDEATVSKADSLRAVALYSVGFDNASVDDLNRRGIGLSNAPGVLHETTADLTWALILAAARRTHEAERFVRDGRWDRWELDLMLGVDVHGSTLGIVGYGEIGRAVARRAGGFSMNVLHHTRRKVEDAHSRWVELDELLARSDIVSLHVPLTPETTGMIGVRELGLMKRSAILVNTSRGAVIDQEALIRALETNRIFAAGLDVSVPEPNPDVASPLFQHENCIVLPHIGSATARTRAAMVELAVRNAEAALRDEDLLTPVGHPAPWR